jgi:uncharacterized protein (TIGR00730 family)
MKEIQSVGVYCSSYDTIDGAYRKAAHELGKELAERNITMVFGGGGHGLMGEVAKSVMVHKGRAIGYMPNHLEGLEEPNWEITEMHMVDTMHTRKRLMYENSDGFLVLPGGFGTLDEAFELITWRQLDLHEKPIIFININEYWTPLRELTKNIFEQHFAQPAHKKFFTFVKSVREAFDALYKAPEPTVGEPVDWI